MADGRRSICYGGNAVKKLEKQQSDYYLKSNFRNAENPPTGTTRTSLQSG